MTEKHRHDTVAVADRARAARTQRVAEIQHFGTIAKLPIALDAAVCAARSRGRTRTTSTRCCCRAGS